MISGCLPLVLLLVAGCTNSADKPAKAAAADAAPLHVAVVKAQLRTWPRVVRVQGSLLADEHAIVGAKVAGRVKEVKVDLGAPVRQGEVIMLLDTSDLALRVDQAVAQLEQSRAKVGLKPGESEEQLDPRKVPTVLQEQAVRDEAQSNFERAQMLFDQSAISKEEFQDRQAAVKVAEAKYLSALDAVREQIAQIGVRHSELAVARQVLEDATVRAPFDGIVQQRLVAPGVYVQVGNPVVALVRVNPLRFRAGIPEREAQAIRLKQNVKIHVERQRAVLTAQVTRISPAMDLACRSLMIEVDVPNAQGQLRAGLFGEAEVEVEPQAQTLALPVTAVVEFAGVEKVWRVSQGRAAEKPIRSGRRTAEFVEILEGLAAGDEVIGDARLGRNAPVAGEPAARTVAGR